MFKKITPKVNFPEEEAKTLEFWQKNKIFEKSIEQRDPKNKYIFYDGPPFITGTPHYGTLLSRIAKDVVPRYWTMMGKRVERQWGWDCHGLPIENKVENQLKLKNRREIEKIGVQEFIDKCYSYTKDTSEDWRWYVDKIGQWVDFENSYKTMDQEYMETVMWVFKSLYEKNLVYEGNRVSLYCTRCGTPISNFEIAMDNSYAIMNDPAITIKFPLKGEENTFILAWTTTPWTLPSNRALVVAQKEDYVKVKRKLSIKKKKSVYGLIKNNDRYGVVYAKSSMNYYLPGGGIETGESEEEALIREIKEETGYQNLNVAKKLGQNILQFSMRVNEVIEIDQTVYLVELTGKERKSPILTEFERKVTKQEFTWLTKDEALEKLAPEGYDQYIKIAEGEMAEDELKDMKYLDKEVEEFIILAKTRAKETFKSFGTEEAEYEIVEEFKGKDLVGKEYEPLYDFFAPNDKDFKIYSYEDMVTMDDGVGVVHSAPGFGDIDTQMGQHYGLTMMFSVDDEGKFIKEVTKWAGMYIKKADPFIIKDLEKRNLLFYNSRIDHRYPFCYRCETPLIHRAQNSWYLKVSSLKEDMKKNNEFINWVPEHFKYGRFLKGIESAPDWGISRTRYWATPMPVWRSEDGDETVVIGSREELRKLATEPITKLVLINSDLPTVIDGEITSKGWEEAREIEKEFDKEEDLVLVSSNLTRSIEMLTPLSKGKVEREIHKIDILGSQELEKVMSEKISTLLTTHSAETLSDIDENILLEEFSDDLVYIKSQLDKVFSENAGKVILIAVDSIILSLIRHIITGKTLRVAFRTNPKAGKTKVLYLDGVNEFNLHKPYIDKFTIKSEKSGKVLKRIFDVCDVWLDSASMPYAMLHYPFENKDDLEANFPADFVVEYVAQTRAWFYVMHVVSTALMDTHPFKNVVTTGVMAGTDGRKMSKSYGNYPDPKATILKYGADPIRLYFMGSKIMVAEDVAMSEDMITEQIKTILLPLWNSLSFFTTYANIADYKPGNELFQFKRKGVQDYENWNKVPFIPKDHLNTWILSKLQLSARNIRVAFEEYNIPKAVKEYPEFLSNLSKWYIRRSRDKFNSQDRESFDTLYYVLVEFAKMLAPVAPFISEEVYQILCVDQFKDIPSSIHLCDFPDDDWKFLENSDKVLAQMDIVRDIVTLGQSLRVQNNIKVRQPLSEIEVTYVMEPGREIQMENWMKELISEELNIKLVQEDRQLNDYAGWVHAEGDNYGLKVSLNTNLDAGLIREGVLRELQRAIQSQRKKSQMNIEDFANVEIIVESDALDETLNMIKGDLAQSVKAKSLIIKVENVSEKSLEINNTSLKINVSPA